MSVCSVHVHSISIYYLRLLLILFITWQQNERKTRWYTFWTFSIALPPFSDDTIEFKLDIVYHRAHRFFFSPSCFARPSDRKKKKTTSSQGDWSHYSLPWRVNSLFGGSSSYLCGGDCAFVFFFFCCCLLIRMGNRHSLDNLSGD